MLVTKCLCDLCGEEIDENKTANDFSCNTFGVRLQLGGTEIFNKSIEHVCLRCSQDAVTKVVQAWDVIEPKTKQPVTSEKPAKNLPVLTVGKLLALLNGCPNSDVVCIRNADSVGYSALSVRDFHVRTGYAMFG